jgi:hypothetical protein
LAAQLVPLLYSWIAKGFTGKGKIQEVKNLAEKNKSNKLTQIRSADSAALGNEEIAEQVEVTTGDNIGEKHLHKEDPDMFIGQKPDESQKAHD